MAWLDSVLNAGLNLGIGLIGNRVSSGLSDDALEEYQRRADQAAAIVGQAANEQRDVLRQGATSAKAYLAPYIEPGMEGLNRIRLIANQSPDQMTPSQRRLVERYNRDAMASLAASGLRGAGRSGIAAINEGRAALLADLYDTNRERSDLAADRLLQTGVTGSTGSADIDTSLATAEGNALMTGALGRANALLGPASAGLTQGIGSANDIGNLIGYAGGNLASSLFSRPSKYLYGNPWRTELT